MVGKLHDGIISEHFQQILMFGIDDISDELHEPCCEGIRHLLSPGLFEVGVKSFWLTLGLPTICYGAGYYTGSFMVKSYASFVSDDVSRTGVSRIGRVYQFRRCLSCFPLWLTKERPTSGQRDLQLCRLCGRGQRTAKPKNRFEIRCGDYCGNTKLSFTGAQRSAQPSSLRVASKFRTVTSKVGSHARRCAMPSEKIAEARLAAVAAGRIDRVSMIPAKNSGVTQSVAGDPFNEELIGPSSSAWSRLPGEYGKVAFFLTDGGTASPAPDGNARPAKLLRVELPCVQNSWLRRHACSRGQDQRVAGDNLTLKC